MDFRLVLPVVFKYYIMRKSLLILLTLPFILMSCTDDVDCIYQDERLCDPNYIGNVSEGIVDFNDDMTGYTEKFLLEEFTGFLCTNCPSATAQAKNLAAQYEGRLMLVAVHCTQFFAAPFPNTEPGDPFNLDFRTTEGEIYHSYYNPPGLPDGVINRLGTENSATISASNWADKLAELMPENNPEVYIRIVSTEIDADSTELSAKILVKPLVIGDDVYTINMGLTESGIHEAQKTVGGVTLYDYVHDHVFRRNSNGNWGTIAYNNELELNSNQALAFTLRISLEPSWKIENCEAFVYISKESNREILQVEAVHLGN